MKLSQFNLRDLFLAVTAIGVVIGVHLAFWKTGPQESNHRLVLGWFLLATGLATALSLTSNYRRRTPFLATALLGWAYFAFVLKLGYIQHFAEAEWLESGAWMGLCLMGPCLLVSLAVTSVVTRSDPRPQQ